MNDKLMEKLFVLALCLDEVSLFSHGDEYIQEKVGEVVDVLNPVFKKYFNQSLFVRDFDKIVWC